MKLNYLHQILQLHHISFSILNILSNIHSSAYPLPLFSLLNLSYTFTPYFLSYFSCIICTIICNNKNIIISFGNLDLTYFQLTYQLLLLHYVLQLSLQISFWCIVFLFIFLLNQIKLI